MKNNTSIIIATVALIVALGAGYGLAGGKQAAPKNDIVSGMHQMTDGTMMGKGSRDMYSTHGSGTGMSDMIASMSNNLKGKTGDEFDREFLSEMITHHEGAVEMANLALTNANRKEIRDLAGNIISAQNKEIGDMKKWQKEWYGIEN